MLYNNLNSYLNLLWNWMFSSDYKGETKYDNSALF